MNRKRLSWNIGLLIVYVLVTAWTNFAVAEPPPEVAQLPVEMQKLPKGVQAWYVYESFYISRFVNGQKLKSPTQNFQDEFFAPESRNIFDLSGVWLSEDEVQVYQSRGFSDELRDLFQRQRDGKKEYLLLIHPESKDLYKDILEKKAEVDGFRAVATASSRSLLVWQKGQEQTPFIAKVSLNKMIGYVLRNLKGGEAARSVGFSQTLEGSQSFPENALYMPEPFSLIPKDMETGAMILRQFPKEFLSGESYFLPLFALYGEGNGPLLQLIQKSGLAPDQYVKEKILLPFVRLWAQLVIEQKLLMEPHAQNILVEIKDGELTPRFVLRDFGGLNINFAARSRANLFVPDDLPSFNGDMKKDYYTDIFEDYIPLSLENYFEAGFLYAVEMNISRWARNGLLPDPPNRYYHLHDTFIETLSEVLSERTGSRIVIDTGYRNLRKVILQLMNRSTLRKQLLGCFQFLQK